MNNNFVSMEMNELRNYIINKQSFSRYDLQNFCDLYNEFRKKFKTIHQRNIFAYEFLEKILKDLESKELKKIKKIIYEKDFNWFERVGQYFFYNLSQWRNNGNGNYRDFPDLFKTREKNFIEDWWKSFINYELNSYPKSKLAPKYPKKILLELTNNCNLNCVMCGIGAYGYDKSRNLDLKLLKNMKNEVLNKVELIRINGLGESTIITNFLEYLKILSSLNKKLEIITNLTIQNEKIWNSLLDVNTNFLISCDSANPKNYESIRRGARFESFLDNLKYIGSNINHPLQGQIIFTLMRQNINDIPGVIDLAAKYSLGGVNINVVKLDDHNYFSNKEIRKIIKVFEKSYKIANDLGINLKLPDHLDETPVNPNISSRTCKDSCTNPWEEVYVRYNGDLTPCNMLNPYVYGNLNLNTFTDLWNGLNAYLFRNFVNTEYRHNYCHNCYYLMS